MHAGGYSYRDLSIFVEVIRNQLWGADENGEWRSCGFLPTLPPWDGSCKNTPE